MTDSEYHQVNLELQQMLEEALNRAQDGKATTDDWNLIWYGCGLSKRVKSKGESNESYSESGF